jgi:hypothetical protein
MVSLAAFAFPLYAGDFSGSGAAGAITADNLWRDIQPMIPARILRIYPPDVAGVTGAAKNNRESIANLPKSRVILDSSAGQGTRRTDCGSAKHISWLGWKDARNPDLKLTSDRDAAPGIDNAWETFVREMERGGHGDLFIDGTETDAVSRK